MTRKISVKLDYTKSKGDNVFYVMNLLEEVDAYLTPQKRLEIAYDLVHNGIVNKRYFSNGKGDFTVRDFDTPIIKNGVDSMKIKNLQDLQKGLSNQFGAGKLVKRPTNDGFFYDTFEGETWIIGNDFLNLPKKEYKQVMNKVDGELKEQQRVEDLREKQTRDQKEVAKGVNLLNDVKDSLMNSSLTNEYLKIKNQQSKEVQSGGKWEVQDGQYVYRLAEGDDDEVEEKVKGDPYNDGEYYSTEKEIVSEEDFFSEDNRGLVLKNAQKDSKKIHDFSESKVSSDWFEVAAAEEVKTDFFKDETPISEEAFFRATPKATDFVDLGQGGVLKACLGKYADFYNFSEGSKVDISIPKVEADFVAKGDDPRVDTLKRIQKKRKDTFKKKE